MLEIYNKVLMYPVQNITVLDSLIRFWLSEDDGNFGEVADDIIKMILKKWQNPAIDKYVKDAGIDLSE